MQDKTNPDRQSVLEPADEQVLRILAEQLKLPLLQVSQHLEIVRNGGKLSLDQLEVITDMAINLVDSYVLSRQLDARQMELHLEPVSVSSVLYASAERLRAFARQYNCDVRLQLGGRYLPVIAHRQGLEMAFTALGYSFIEAQTQKTDKPSTLILAAHKSRAGVVAGVYSDQAGLTMESFRRGKLLFGRSRQPIPSLSHGAGAGIFVAGALLESMASPLRVARYHKLNGLAATLLPNSQLQMVEM